jgi:hypothetical protein
MCDLNAIELAWAKIKRIVTEHNVTADLSLKKLLQTAHDAIGQVNQEDWEGFCQHIESLEKQYWEMDDIVPDVIVSIAVTWRRPSSLTNKEGCKDTKTFHKQSSVSI